MCLVYGCECPSLCLFFFFWCGVEGSLNQHSCKAQFKNIQFTERCFYLIWRCMPGMKWCPSGTLGYNQVTSKNHFVFRLNSSIGILSILYNFKWNYFTFWIVDWTKEAISSPWALGTCNGHSSAQNLRLNRLCWIQKKKSITDSLISCIHSFFFRQCMTRVEGLTWALNIKVSVEKG